jgi:phosphoheptose isomerase
MGIREICAISHRGNRLQNDPRHRNELCDKSSVGAYLTDYASRLKKALDTVDREALETARRAIDAAASYGRRIYAIGNGGSAAIADHLCCDWTKGTHSEGHPTIDTLSLSSNVALYTAIANDYGFERVFEAQLTLLGKRDDVLLAISSSGNSPNILMAVEKARDLRMTSIGLSGFDGGKLKETADISLHVASKNYGIVEDAHQSLTHVLAQFLAIHRDDRKADVNQLRSV